MERDLAAAAPAFFKVMLGDFSKSLRIPHAFIIRMKGSSTDKFILESHAKGIWPVEVKKNGNDMFLQSGWPAFVEHHSIVTGEFVVFKYHGGSKFLVEIFGKNGCLKEEALADEKCENLLDKRSVRFKSAHSDKVEVSPFLREVGLLSTKNKNYIFVNSGDLDADPSCPHLHEVSSSSVEIIEDENKQPTKKEHMLHQPLCTNSIQSDKVRVTESLREVEPFSTENNGGGNSVNHGNLTGRHNYSHPCEVSRSSQEIMENDSKLAKKRHALRRSLRIKSIQTNGKETRELKNASSLYSASLPCQTHDTAFSSKPGGFCSSEQIPSSELGCILEQENSVSMDVSPDTAFSPGQESVECSISSERGGTDEHASFSESCNFLGEKGVNSLGKMKPCTYPRTFVSKRRSVTSKEKNRVVQTARALRSINPFFTVVMRPTHVYRGFFMTLPLSFFKTYLGKEKDIILKVSDKKKWSVRLISRKDGVGLSKGWSAFVWGNNLEEGDVCVFELVNRTKITFRVTIFRVVEQVVPLRRHAMS